MRVRILVGIAGQGINLQPGEVVDLPEDWARALCAEPPESPRAEALEDPGAGAPATRRARRVTTPTETRG